jgi:alkylhydroperoxidase family enzyme
VSGLDGIEWETCLLEPLKDRAAERSVRKALGFVPTGVRYFLDAPWVTRTSVRLDIGHIPMLHLSLDLGEMVALVVSQESSCRYCYAATRSVMTILGFPAARIRRLEEDFLTADLAPRDTLALEFARAVSRAVPLPTRVQARPLLDAGEPPDAVKELAVVAAANVFFNRLSTLPALPPEQMEISHRWAVPLMRLVMRRHLRPKRAPQREPLRAEQREGAYAPFVNALDGLPVAARLRSVIDDALQPSALSQRVKGLVFAVVARGLGCPLSEQEAARLLLNEGMTPAQIDHALAHLSGPELDPLERAAVSLARESIWYRPAPLQRQVRSIRPLFSRQQFVELIATAALANMVCRLSVAVDLDRPPD